VTTAFELSIATADLRARMATRLRGGAATPKVVWQNQTRRVLVHTDSIAVRSLDGWLLVNLDLETDQTKKRTLQFVFYMGKREEGDSVHAACTINAPTPEAAQLADGWGRDLQRVLWDAVLDSVEACVARVAAQVGTQAVTLGGFFSNAQSIVVSVLAGA
jgi:hypothetical protein